MRSINDYLKPWGSIRGNRSGMLNSSMARALAPYDEASDENYQDLLKLLKQDPSRLHCVYCDADAAEWDHLIPIMRDGIPTGFGHQFGNLVPACSACNGEKRTSDWTAFLKVKAKAEIDYEYRRSVVEAYRQHFSPQPTPNPVSVWQQLQGIREQVLKLFAEADNIITARGKVDTPKFP